VAERLNAAWGQSVIVDNRSGVGGNIAAAYVARAPADGYTLMVGTDAIMTSNVFLYKNTPFDPVKDFAPITNAGANIICLAVHVDLPVNSVAELIAYAKAHPGQLQYGSSGIGSPHHLAGELLRQKTGIDIVHVPYRGGGATINDLLGGHIKVAFLSLSTAVPHLGSGKIKIVAVVEKARYAAMPDIPAVGETVAGFEMSSWVASQRGDGEGAHNRCREGEARHARSCGRAKHTGRACRHREGRSRRARPAGEGRQYPGRVAGVMLRPSALTAVAPPS